VVIPVADDNPTVRRAWVTYVLIALNVVVFFLEPVTVVPSVSTSPVAQVCEQESFFRRWAAIPKELVENEQLPQTVAAEPVGDSCAIVEPDYEKSPILSALFSMFLHGGLLHLLGNMLFLWVFGNNVEDRLGRLTFLLFYLGAGLVATYGFALANADSTTVLVGASGAVAGVLGAYLVMFPRARVTSVVPVFFFFPFRLPAWLVLGGWFALQYLYARGTALAEGAGVAYLAHVLGFAAGFAYALVAAPRRARPVRDRQGRGRWGEERR
jgi:membrane associated rhomboid family serine protease